MPCSMALRQPGSLSSETSEWVCRSMKPGATANPARSISSTAGAVGDRVADRHDPAVVDRQVAVDGGAAGPVVEACVAQDDVDHRSASAPDVT